MSARCRLQKDSIVKTLGTVSELMIKITAEISLNEDALRFAAIRAGGPGGQHVNTTNSAVQLKFDAANCPAISTQVFSRLKTHAGQRMSAAGIVQIDVSETRSQHRNREIATERLVALIRAAAAVPKARRKTKPSKGSKERRLGAKSRTAGLKRTRGRVKGED